jgi:CheY-like chemotaxis protein
VTELMLPVVIVDDASQDLVFAERVFAECKILNPLVCLKGGKECLEYFSKLGPGDKYPCLALIDLMMPHPNGVEVLRRLCNSPSGKNTVFVMLSGLADIKLIQQGYRHGARTFLVKPLSKEDVLRLLDALKGISITAESGGFVISYEAPQSPPGSDLQKGADEGSMSLSS